jgi:hypothetical protein
LSSKFHSAQNPRDGLFLPDQDSFWKKRNWLPLDAPKRHNSSLGFSRLHTQIQSPLIIFLRVYETICSLWSIIINGFAVFCFEVIHQLLSKIPCYILYPNTQPRVALCLGTLSLGSDTSAVVWTDTSSTSGGRKVGSSTLRRKRVGCHDSTHSLDDWRFTNELLDWRWCETDNPRPNQHRWPIERNLNGWQIERAHHLQSAHETIRMTRFNSEICRYQLHHLVRGKHQTPSPFSWTKWESKLTIALL